MLNRSALFPFLFIISLQVFSQSLWTVDHNLSKVTFVVNGSFGTKVNGKLSAPVGVIKFSPDNLENSSFKVVLDVSALSTDNIKRDNHLRKEEFFNLIKYKDLSFTSSKIEQTKSGFVTTGMLRIKDKLKQVKIPFVYSFENNKVTFKGEFNINRLDYGVGTSSLLVGDEVRITIVVVATQ